MNAITVADPASLRSPLHEAMSRARSGLSAAEELRILPGADFAGYTFDVVHGTMHPDNQYLKSYLFRRPDRGGADDWKAREVAGRRWLVPSFADALPNQRASISIEEGSSLQEYARNVAGSVGLEGSYGFFEGSLESSFSMSDARLSRLRFSTLSDDYQMWSVHLTHGRAARPFLDRDALVAIDTAPPAELFRRWGTHYIHGVLVGARALVSLRTRLEQVSSERELKTKIEMSYNFGIGKVRGGMESEYRQAAREVEESSTRQVTMIGGDPTLARQVMDGRYDEWLASVASHPMPTGFTRDGLQPIWELTVTDERRRELQRAFDQYRDGVALAYPARLPLQEGDVLVFEADNGRYVRYRPGDTYRTLEAKATRLADAARLTVRRTKDGDRWALLESDAGTGIDGGYTHGISAAGRFETLDTRDGRFWWTVQPVAGHEGWYAVRSQSVFGGGTWWSREPETALIRRSSDDLGKNLRAHFRFHILPR